MSRRLVAKHRVCENRRRPYDKTDETDETQPWGECWRRCSPTGGGFVSYGSFVRAGSDSIRPSEYAFAAMPKKALDPSRHVISEAGAEPTSGGLIGRETTLRLLRPVRNGQLFGVIRGKVE